MIQDILHSIKLADIMTKPVVTVSSQDEFHVVWEKMAAHDIRHIPVVDHAGTLVGIITERNLFKIHSPRKLEDGSWFYDKDMLDGFILTKVMVQEPFFLKPQNTIREAMQVIAQFKYGCIPVVDDNKVPVGIITRNNIIKFFLNHA